MVDWLFLPQNLKPVVGTYEYCGSVNVHWVVVLFSGGIIFGDRGHLCHIVFGRL